MDAFLKDLAKFIADLTKYVASLAAKIPPEQIPPPVVPPMPIVLAPAINHYLWDTRVNSRHSVRVICDEMGLTLHEKNVITAVIQAESDFNNKAVNHNKNASGKITSTDYGICQINTWYHIGKAGDFPSVEYVLAHPDVCVRWMIKLYREGHLNWWSAYANGRYKKFLV